MLLPNGHEICRGGYLETDIYLCLSKLYICLYPCILTLFQYITQNIPGPGCDMDMFESRLIGCNCIACDINCKCFMNYGIAYEHNRIKPVYLGSSVNPVFECNSRCACSIECPNRVVQHGITIKLQIFVTENKGLGVRTLDIIHKGTFVCEYAGEIISLSEAKHRTKQQKESDMNYILTVREHCKNGVMKTYVDPVNFGNIGRYINHSCSPNLTMVPVRVDTMVPKICLFANKDIAINDEIAYSYGPISDCHKSERPCHCSSEHCIGFLPSDEDLL